MTNKTILDIKNLYANAGNKEIIKGLNLIINEGEVHAIMGPNGGGKSTLANVLSGKPGYTPTSGSVAFKGKDLFSLDVEERANEGLFLLMQYPIEIEGVAFITFLEHALNAKRTYEGQKEIDMPSFMRLVRDEANRLFINSDMLKRAINAGFSGGEKKKMETLQMAILQPTLAILDEADSGLDIDALKIVSGGINNLRDEKRAFLIITHHQDLLEQIEPDFVHVFAGGRIVKSGDKNLALQLEAEGYTDFIKGEKC